MAMHRTEKRAVQIPTVAGLGEVRVDQPLRLRMHGQIAFLAALALDPDMRHALAAGMVAQLQPAKFLATKAMIEERGENSAVSKAFWRIDRRCFEQAPRLGVAGALGSCLHCPPLSVA